ncbi:hypothetical protein BB8028_0007g00100 [Beauveria bassiana]|uniref:Uncharacterized protein n=1 Tax=Beauveria bassiana TaxID=176275 RepID=A0A2S7YKV0_BEABA|nr:hypothetical protein BB8028_0007g00100 [Beauveria bassiana]
MTYVTGAKNGSAVMPSALWSESATIASILPSEMPSVLPPSLYTATSRHIGSAMYMHTPSSGIQWKSNTSTAAVLPSSASLAFSIASQLPVPVPTTSLASIAPGTEASILVIVLATASFVFGLA